MGFEEFKDDTNGEPYPPKVKKTGNNPDDLVWKGKPDDEIDFNELKKASGISDKNPEIEAMSEKWDANGGENPDTPAGEGVDIDELAERWAEEDANGTAPKEAQQPEYVPGTCIICGSKIKKSSSSYYCNDCREKYLKVDFGARHIIMAVIMFIALAVGILVSISTVKLSSNIWDGDKYYSEGFISKAQDSYNNVDTTLSSLNDGVNSFIQGINSEASDIDFYNAGSAYKRKLAVISVDTLTTAYDSRSSFISLVDGYFSETELNDSKYAEVKAAYEYCKKMDTTANGLYDKWYELLQSYMSQYSDDSTASTTDKVKYTDILDYIDKYKSSNKDADESTINYYKFMSVYYASQYEKGISEKDAVKYLEKAYDEAGKYNYTFVSSYISFAYEIEDYDKVIALAKVGIAHDPSNTDNFYYAVKVSLLKSDFNTADNYCTKLKEYNPDSLDYYSIKAEVLRRQSKLDEAIDICEKGLESGDDDEILRQEAIAYQLKGGASNESKALELAKNAYNVAYSKASADQNVSLSVETMNTSALICKLDGDDDTYSSIVSIIEQQNGQTIEDVVTKCIKGKITFEDIFMDGKGDI